MLKERNIIVIVFIEMYLKKHKFNKLTNSHLNRKVYDFLIFI
jgi:hypothetical protein